MTLGVVGQEARSATSSVSYDGSKVSLSAENGSFGQVLELFKQQTGLEYDVPTELKSERLPLVDIQGLSVRAALLKLLEGSNYDYILMAVPSNPEKISKLLIIGKSTKIAPSSSNVPRGMASAPGRITRHVVEDPFGGGQEDDSDDANANNAGANNQPEENLATQGVVPAQPGVQPGTPVPGQVNPGQVNPAQPNPFQPYQPGVTPQQQQPGQPMVQPQVLQPFPGNNPNNQTNQNDRRSPF
jgi:hypothetical protein